MNEQNVLIDYSFKTLEIPEYWHVIGVQTDNNSRRMFFRIVNTPDEIDLSKCAVIVKYQNAKGQTGKYMVQDLTKELNSAYSFSFLIPDSLCIQPGTVYISLQCIQDDTVLWNIAPIGLKVLRQLNEPDEIIQSDPKYDMLVQYIEKVDTLTKSLDKSGLKPELLEKINTVEEGAQKNSVQTISVNGNPVVVDESRNVNLIIPVDNNELMNGAGYLTEKDIAKDLESYPNKDEMDEAIQKAVEAVPVPDLSPYALKTDIHEPDLSGYALKTEIPNVSGYALKTDIKDPDLSLYALKTEIPDLTGYALKTDITEPDLSPYALKSEIKDPDLSPYALKTDIKEPDLSGYALKSEIPDISDCLTAEDAEEYTPDEIQALWDGVIV